MKKTEEFVRQYNEDIKLLTIGDVVPKLKGSFKRANIGEYITDIDNNSFVTFTEELHTSIYDMLSNLNDRFIFLYLGCGWKEKYIPPWTIDEIGGCVFDYNMSYDWYMNIKDDIVKKDRDKIDTLFTQDMKIKDLITIRNILKNYGEIKWHIDDIRVGYVEYEGRKYYLYDVLKTHNGILEFIYTNGYISVTTNLFDTKYKVDMFKSMWPFYTKDYYKIIKSIKWLIYSNQLKEGIYKNTIDAVQKYVSILYQVENINNIRQYKPQMEDICDIIWRDNISPYIKNMTKNLPSKPPKSLDKLESQLKSYIDKITLKNFPEDKLLTFIKNPEDRKILEIKIFRMHEADKATSIAELRDRWEDGTKCPFFTIDIDSMYKMADITKRTYIPLKTVLDCFVEVSKTQSIPLHKTLELVSDNNLYIQKPKGKNIVKLFYNSKSFHEFPISKLNNILKYVLFL